MRIKIQQYLFFNHSWAVVGENLGRALIKLGHQVDFAPTTKTVDKCIPEDLRPFILKPTSVIESAQKYHADYSSYGPYDCQISYTAPHNWRSYLSAGSKNRFGIWNYEYNVRNGIRANLLSGFAKNHIDTDLVLPSSNFTREVFINMGIPESKMVVVPHGINLEEYSVQGIYKLNTKKSKKIFLNIAQPHKRKALHLALESFGKAFTNKDDVCLVAKIFVKNSKAQQFDVNWDEILASFKKKFPNHAEIEVIKDYIPSLTSLYRACDINFSATHAECWHLPSLEALSCGLINVVPAYGGILDFCNDENSLLINGSVVMAPRDTQYWTYNQFAVHYKIDTDHAAGLLQKAVIETASIKERLLPGMMETSQKFTWESAARKILELHN